MAGACHGEASCGQGRALVRIGGGLRTTSSSVVEGSLSDPAITY
jgi:hypothetical protein